MEELKEVKKEIVIDDETLLNNKIDWNNLVFSLKLSELKLLELMYLPTAKPHIKKELDFFMRRLGYCKKTTQRKINKLASIGLVERVRSSVVIVNPVPEIENNVIELIKQMRIRFGGNYEA